MRKFPAHQLANTESELASAGFHADRLGFDIGDHSDEIHWDEQKPVSAADWLNEIALIRGKIDRAEGLLRAYELFRKAEQGESYDDASAR